MERSDSTVLEYGYLSLFHKGEELCGDHVQVSKDKEGATTFVLADGIGSGVVASILSTLASTMLCTMIEQGLSIEEGVDALIKTLPVAKDRGGVAYSTFTICRIEEDYSAVVYNFDNPEPVFLRDGKERPLRYESSTIGGKTIQKANFYFSPGDELVVFTDGAVYAGVGESLNFGWTRDEIVAFLESLYNPSLSAKNLATYLVEQCDILYNRRPGDDTTALAIRRREKKHLALMVGPATRREDDTRRLDEFFHKEMPHVVCGGTTAKIVADYLHEAVEGNLDFDSSDIPPISYINGVDLVTEGIITLNKVLALAKDYQGQNKEYLHWSFRQDGASLLAKMLFEEATDIDFSVGCAVNPAHQGEETGIDIKMKMLIIHSLCEELRRMGKTVSVTYY
ncbi:MAG: PP2C family protein-serine/threonine phosphatase [Candidatus Enteromonas sp.]|nr:PP2C family protein-serine/threonine phosphatase [Candidatus Enteromonas sp.]